MKQLAQYYNHTLGLFVLCSSFLLACTTIHQFPDENAVDPTATNAITLQLNIKAKNIVETQYTFGLNQKIGETQVLRVIIEVYKAKDLTNCVERKEIITNVIDPDILSVKQSFMLSSVKYHFVVWADYIDKSSPNDQFYSTVDLRNVKIVEPMTTNTDHLDCFSGTVDLDLTSYSKEWNVILPLDLTLERPISKYMLIATDVQKFMEKESARNRSIEPFSLDEYRVEVTYKGFMPYSFDVYHNNPNLSRVGFSYEANIKQLDNGEALIGFDYQFLEDNTANSPIGIRIYNSSGDLLNEIHNLDVGLVRGDLVIIRDEFLTKNYVPGITIDPDFEGEFEIILPDK